jgi:hypothetical protein
VKRIVLLLPAIVVCTTMAYRSSAQFPGMPSIQRPNIANIFHPVVGMGAAWEETKQGGKKSTLEMSIVGKEMVGTREAFWMEVGTSAEVPGSLHYGKMLVTPEDFAFHKMITMMPGSAQPIEIDMESTMAHRQTLEKNLDKWHSVGTETITVPAGTFSCDHWTKDDGKGDVWVSSKVSPMGMVKSADTGQTMVLVKLITDAKTHITGTPVKFDPQMMRNRMGQQQP